MRRVFWATLGAGFGFGLSFWTMRAIRRMADRLLPTPLLERVGRLLDSLDGGTGTRLAGQRGVTEVEGRVTTPSWSIGSTRGVAVAGARLRALDPGRAAGRR